MGSQGMTQDSDKLRINLVCQQGDSSGRMDHLEIQPLPPPPPFPHIESCTVTILFCDTGNGK